MAWLLMRLRAGYRGRRASAMLIAILAALIAVVAATTPILIQSVQQAALQQTLVTATELQRSILGDASSNDMVSQGEVGDHAARVTSALGRSDVWSVAQTLREQNDKPLPWTRPNVATGQPQQRVADIPSCGALRFVDGRCPRGSDEGALAESTFNRSGIRLGERVTLDSTLHRVSVRIVGVYDAGTAEGRLAAHPSSVAGASISDLDPDLLVSQGQFTALELPTTAFSIRTLSPRVPLAALPSIRTDIARARAVPLTAFGATASTHMTTRLDGLLDRVDEQRNVVAIILEVVAAGSFAVALAAFGVVAGRLGRVRASEWALPRLRGMRARRRLAARVVEPASALLAGALVGTGAVIAVAVLSADATTRASVIAVVPAAVGFACLATVSGVVALVLVGRAADRRPLEEQLRRATEPRALVAWRARRRGGGGRRCAGGRRGPAGRAGHGHRRRRAARAGPRRIRDQLPGPPARARPRPATDPFRADLAAGSDRLASAESRAVAADRRGAGGGRRCARNLHDHDRGHRRRTRRRDSAGPDRRGDRAPRANARRSAPDVSCGSRRPQRQAGDGRGGSARPGSGPRGSSPSTPTASARSRPGEATGPTSTRPRSVVGWHHLWIRRSPSVGRASPSRSPTFTPASRARRAPAGPISGSS